MVIQKINDIMAKNTTKEGKTMEKSTQPEAVSSVMKVFHI
ncbi:DNA-binding transcriptional regulator KdgR, partial [Vibrio vulnificus]